MTVTRKSCRRAPPFGQWSGVYGDVDSPVARGPQRGHVVHRAGESLGERVCRIVQREAARRTTRPRDLLHTDGSTDLDQTMASRVQHGTVAQCAGLSAAAAGSLQPSVPERIDHEPSSLIRTGSTLGGRSVRHSPGFVLRHGLAMLRGDVPGLVTAVVGRTGRRARGLCPLSCRASGTTRRYVDRLPEAGDPPPASDRSIATKLSKALR